MLFAASVRRSRDHNGAAIEINASPTMYTSNFDRQADWPESTTLPGLNLPAHLQARIATRWAFVQLKQRYMQAVADLSGDQGQSLRERVRHAHHPLELWQLRGTVFAELAAIERSDSSQKMGLMWQPEVSSPAAPTAPSAAA
jgi:hypothetical protein